MSGAYYDDKRVLEQKFEVEWILDGWTPHPCDQEVNPTLAQFLIDDFGLRDHDMNNDARKAPGNAINDGGHEGRGQEGVAPDAHLTGCWVGEKLDVLHAQPKVVEY